MPADLVTGADATDVAAYVAFAAERRRGRGGPGQAGLAGADHRRADLHRGRLRGLSPLSKAGTNGKIGPSLDELASAGATARPRTT